MLFKNYIFDCDGVLLDSNKFKIIAMQNTLADFPPDITSEFLNYFSRNFGKSRYHHINVFFQEYLKTDPMDRQQEMLLEVYGNYCQELYLSCDICDGVINSVTNIGTNNCWVVSGSDEDELINVFKSRGISGLFNKILGSPTAKTKNVALVISDNNLAARDTCLVGDSLGDYEAAIANSIEFIFCKKYSNTPELADRFQRENVKIINTLEELP